MTITLITKEQHAKLVQIQEKHPLLTYMNTGYDTVKSINWSEDDHKAFKEAKDIISTSVKGFTEFNHFRISKKEGEIELRLQYDYQADLTPEERSKTRLGSFTGVGYLLLDELFYGFKD